MPSAGHQLEALGMGRSARNKIEGHPDLLAGESVIDACYGLGGSMLKMADAAGGALTKTIDANPVTGTSASPAYSAQADAVRRGEGMASTIARNNGIVALTDRRLLWCPVKTAIGKPKRIEAAFDRSDVVRVHYERPMLVVEFSDGSTAGLHVPRAQRPADFVSAFEAGR